MKNKVILSFCTILLIVNISAQNTDYPKFRFNANGGINYFVAKVEKNDNYGSQLKWGKNIETNFHYILNSGIGFGIKYNYSYHSAKPTDFIFDIFDGSNLAVVNLAERDYIHYVGLSYMVMRKMNRLNNFLLIGSLSLGYAYLISDVKRDYQLEKLTGKNIGSTIDFGIEYFLQKHISLGLKTGLFYSNIYKINTKDQYKSSTIKLSNDNTINLSNFNLNLSLSYYLN